MSYNFYFISGTNPASTIQALQQTPKALPEPRPRPVLQLVDQLSPEIAPLTEANVQATTPAPRPRNRDILRQRAESIRDDASIRAPSTRRSRSHRSRSPGRQSTQVTGQIDFPPPTPKHRGPTGTMESEYSGNLESVRGINNSFTTSSDWSSILASSCCCCTPAPTTRIPSLYIYSTSQPTGRTKSTCGTGSLTSVFCFSTVYRNTNGSSTLCTTTKWRPSHSSGKSDWHLGLFECHPEPNRVQGMDQWKGSSKFWHERHHGSLHLQVAWCC